MLHMQAVQAARIDSATVRGFCNRPPVVPPHSMIPESLDHAREIFSLYRASAERAGAPCKVSAYWQGGVPPRGILRAIQSGEFESAIGI